MIVVGAGASGLVAAVEAAERGAEVLLLDRWGRGGASARSGGVIYAGGGTPQQIAAGFEDDPETMERYLALEEGVAPDDVLMRRFSERSRHDLTWLVGHGVEVPMGFDPSKAVVPNGNDTGLYFSGNEKHFAPAVPVAARGHRVAGTGMTGRVLVDRLAEAAHRAGVRRESRVRLVDLMTDDAWLGHRCRGPGARRRSAHPPRARRARAGDLAGRHVVPAGTGTHDDDGRPVRATTRADTTAPGPPRGGAGDRRLLLQPRDDDRACSRLRPGDAPRHRR